MVNDLELAKRILIADFDHFENTPFSGGSFKAQVFHAKCDKILDKLFILKEGEEWREMRSAVSPIFTSGKLKKMFGVVNEVCADFEAHLRSNVGVEVNAREVSNKFTVQNMGKLGIGIDVNIFEESQESALFYKMVRKFMGLDATALDALKMIIVVFLPALGNILRIPTFDREAVLFFVDVIQQTMERRKNEQASKQNDMVELLAASLRGRDDHDAEVRRQVEEELETKYTAGKHFEAEDIEDFLVANIFTALMLGMETSALMMSACMCYLANDPDVQDRLFGEVDEAAPKGAELDYDSIMKMQYLDMVANETMRHLPTNDLQRVCNRDYKVPGTDFTIPKGMQVQGRYSIGKVLAQKIDFDSIFILRNALNHPF